MQQPSPLMLSRAQLFEGLRLTAYQDTNKVWTLGNGLTFIHDAKTGVIRHVQEGDYISPEQANAAFLTAAQSRATILSNFLTKNNIGLNKNQFDASWDFAYQEGEGSFESSTLFKRILAGVVDAPFTEQEISDLKAFINDFDKGTTTIEEFNLWAVKNINKDGIYAAFLMWDENGHTPSGGLLKRQIENCLIWSGSTF